MNHLVRLGCCLMAAGPLVAGSMALPAHALPVFTLSEMNTYNVALNSARVPCTKADNPSPDARYVQVAENGAPTALSSSNSGTITRDADPSDVISFATSSTTSGRVTSVGGNPGVIELTTSGSVQVDTTMPTSMCVLNAASGGSVDAKFAVTQGGFMTFTTKASRRSYAIAHVNDLTGDVYLDVDGYGPSFSDFSSVYLPPGTYAASLEGAAFISGSAMAVPVTPVTVSIRATFLVAGSQTEQVFGTGQKYLTFPATRSCGTGSVDVAVTRKGKRAKQVRKVRLFVNDAKVRSLTSPKKGLLVRLPVPAETDADIRAEVVLKPAKPGRKPRTHEVAAGYIACSAG
jgi:hypothetical protein